MEANPSSLHYPCEFSSLAKPPLTLFKCWCEANKICWTNFLGGKIHMPSYGERIPVLSGSERKMEAWLFWKKTPDGNIVFSFVSPRIEKKRAVVPELAEAVKTRDGREVNWEYFYQLLFTLDNLKLVHIACHKKTNHNLSCDKTRIYRKRKQIHEIS